jgi:hypothetical protein
MRKVIGRQGGREWKTVLLFRNSSALDATTAARGESTCVVPSSRYDDVVLRASYPPCTIVDIRIEASPLLPPHA